MPSIGRYVTAPTPRNNKLPPPIDIGDIEYYRFELFRIMDPNLGTLNKPQRVTRQHTLERVRNNQRRHRARRRDHVTEVEEKLVELEQHVASLQERVKALEAELEIYRGRSTPLASGITPFPSTNAEVGPHASIAPALAALPGKP